MYLVFPPTFTKSIGVKAERVWPQLFHIMSEVGRDVDHRPFGDKAAGEFGISHCHARHRWHRGAQSQRFFHHQRGTLHGLHIVIAESWLADGQRFFANALLPIRILAEIIEHVRQGNSGGVVGRHHQKDHVINHVLVTEPFTILSLGPAQYAKQIAAIAIALASHPATEKLL